MPSNAHALFARPLVTSPNSVLTVAVPADGNRSRISADGRRIVEIPDGGRVDVRRADQPVRIARVHASTFGDRLVAKFGLPVRGFRDAATTPVPATSCSPAATCWPATSSRATAVDARPPSADGGR